MQRTCLFEALENRTLLAGVLTQVHEFDLWNANPRVIKSTDIAGLTYHPPSGHLFIADSEIDEISQFNNVNVFEADLGGSTTYNEFWPGKNKEPTGIIWNEYDGYFYITNDDAKTISRFDEKLDSVKTQVTVSGFGINDPEDITADGAGLLYVVSGHPVPLVAVFDSNLKYLSQFSLGSKLSDAEGIAYDKQTGHLFIVSSANRRIVEYTTSGQYLEEYFYDGLVPKPQTPQGLAFAPCSNNASLQCLYIADGGIDNYPDGQVYEVRIGNSTTTAPPVANGQSVSTNEDTSIAITLTGSDPSDKSLTYSIDTFPSHGAVTGKAPTVQYLPNSEYNGPDSFTFRVNNGTTTSAPATVAINVKPVNDAPIATPLSVFTPLNTPLPLVLTGTDVDGDPLSFTILSNPSSGALSGTAPNVSYQPDPGFSGSDSFDFQVKDASGAKSTATVNITVSEFSAPETIMFQTGLFPTTGYAGTQDTKIRGDQPTSVFGTSSKLELDGKPDISSLLRWDVRQIPVGSLVKSASITINVVNNSVDTFQLYELLRSWDEKTASFNQASTGIPWEVAGAQGASDRGTTVLGSVTAPQLGTVIISLNSAGIAAVQKWVDDSSSNNGLTIQNYADPSTDDLDFASREASTASQRPKLTVDFLTGVASTPRNPVADSNSVTTAEDTLVGISLTGSDPSGKPLTYSIVQTPLHGTLSGTAPTVQYKPNSDYNGPDSFIFKVSNGTDSSAPATIAIDVTPVNDPPVATPQSVTTLLGTAIPFVLSGTDVDGDILSYSVVTGPTAGTLSGTAPDLTYTPNSGFSGIDSFKFQVADPSGASSQATVSIDVVSSTNPDSMSFQNGVFPTTSYAGTVDAKIRGDDPTRANGTSTTLEIDGKPDIATLLKWDIHQISAGSVVQAASITINVVNNSVDVFQLYELLRPWDEKTASYLLAATGTSWEVAGAQGASDRGTTVLGAVTAPQLGTVVIQLNSDGVATVQKWVNDPSSNFGLTFQNYNDPSTDDLDFSAKETSNSLQRPKLTVNYFAGSSPISRSLVTNADNPFDVNADQTVSSADALVIVNRLNNSAESEGTSDQKVDYPDVSGDGLVTPQDMLLVINLLQRQVEGDPDEDSDVANDDELPATASNDGTNSGSWLIANSQLGSSLLVWDPQPDHSIKERQQVDVLMPQSTVETELPVTGDPLFDCPDTTDPDWEELLDVLSEDVLSQL